MSLLHFKESKSTEMQRLPSFNNVDSTEIFQSKLDSPNYESIKDELKRIRGENPNLYKALSLDRFD